MALVIETQVGLARALADGAWYRLHDLAQALDISHADLGEHLRRLHEWGLEVEISDHRRCRMKQALEMLGAQAIGRAMPSLTRRIPIEILTTVDSTNSYLMSSRLGPAGRACLAEYQHRGRGRRGRHWNSPFGVNLYLSVGWRLSGKMSQIELLPLAVGVSCASYLRDHCTLRVGLKWPNDLVIDGKKLGGILVEQAAEPGGGRRVVVGVGINVRMRAGARPGLAQPWTSLDRAAEDGYRISRNVLAANLIDCILQARTSMALGGLASWLARWGEFDVLRGMPVDVTTVASKYTGTAAGIARDGTLIVETTCGRQHFVSGDVTVRSAKPMAGAVSACAGSGL